MKQKFLKLEGALDWSLHSEWLDATNTAVGHLVLYNYCRNTVFDTIEYDMDKRDYANCKNDVALIIALLAYLV